MSRVLTINNLLQKKFKTFDFEGIWADTIGQPETTGAWLIYGAEKNGKTWLSLKLADYLSQFEPTLYVSAEEGTGKNFVDSCKRANLDFKNKNLHFLEYISIEDLSEKLAKRRSDKIIIIDNVTIYQGELNGTSFRKLLRKHPNKLFVFIAHQDRKQPDGSVAKLIKKLAKIIIRVEGLSCFISGRCPGGILQIDEEKSKLYHGNNELETLPTK